MTGSWKNWCQRIATTLILLPIVLAAFWQGGVFLFALMAVVSVLAAFEWAGMAQPEKKREIFALLSVCLLSLLLFMQSASIGLSVQWGGLIALFALIACLYTHLKISALLGGFLYLAPPLIALLALRMVDNGVWLIIYLTIIVWVTDVFALFAGQLIGGAKLVPSISPNKTWAGFLSGLLGAAASSVLFGYWQDISHPTHMFLLGASLSLLAQMGDLFESVIKRHYNVKDSGALLPGHGGILDRIDSLLPVFVVALALLYLRRSDDVLSARALFIW